MRWWSPPPHRTAYFCSDRQGGSVCRVSSTRADGGLMPLAYGPYRLDALSLGAMNSQASVNLFDVIALGHGGQREKRRR